MFRLIVSGDRRLSDYLFLAATLDRLLIHRHPHVTILHGDAPGADQLAAQYAASHWYPVEAYPADWDVEGPSAGPRRNTRMLEAQPSGLVVFDGGGPGSANMLRQARARGMVPRVIDVRHLVTPAD
jgi:hypothetical protein